MLLAHVNRPITFFTDEECIKDIAPLARDNVEFIIQPFHHMTLFNQFPQEFWEEELKKDLHTFHTWQLGAIWANKVKFVEQAAERHPEEEWWLWMDAGCIRTPDWIPYLEDFTYREFIRYEPGVYLQGLWDPPAPEDLAEFKDQNIEGAIILIHKDYINKFNTAYNVLLHRYHNSDISCILDQIVLTTISYKNKSWIHRVVNKQKALPDTMFFFLACI